MKSKPSRRKILLINKGFQLRFLAYMLAIAVVTIGLFFVAKFYFFLEVQQYLLESGLPRHHMVFDFISKQSSRMNWIFVIAAAVECFFLAWIGLRLSNRIAGPLYRLHRELLDLGDGAPLKEVRFRKNDYFPELQHALNKFLHRLKEHLG